MSAGPGLRLDPAITFDPRIPDASSVKLVGLGGVGSIVARYLTVFLRTLDTDVRLVLVDGDTFEPDNAQRMLFGRHGNKAEVVREDLLPYLHESRVALAAVPEYVTPENIGNLVREGDLVILGVDNSATRKLVNDHCAGLSDVCLISGGNDGVEELPGGRSLRGTYGNCHLYVRRGGQDLAPSLAKFHDEIANPVDHSPADASCTELMTSVPQILFANLMAAATILNTAWLYLCGALHYYEVCFDIAEARMHALPIHGGQAIPGPTDGVTSSRS